MLRAMRIYNKDDNGEWDHDCGGHWWKWQQEKGGISKNYTLDNELQANKESWWELHNNLLSNIKWAALKTYACK